MSEALIDGVFVPLRDPAAFAQAFAHPELGTVVWPGGADLNPEETALPAVAAARIA